jgi:hypothetical protein
MGQGIPTFEIPLQSVSKSREVPVVFFAITGFGVVIVFGMEARKRFSPRLKASACMKT